MTSLAHRARNSRQKTSPNGRELFDIIILGDMTRAGDIGLRVAQEARLYDEMGYRVGLMHMKTERSRAMVSPELQECIRKGIAEVLDPSWRVEAALAIVH